MVAAVFHSPLEASPPPAVRPTPSNAAKPMTASQAQTASAASAQNKPARDFQGFWMAVLPPIMGLAALVLVWHLIASTTGSGIPQPAETWAQAVKVFSDPFYRNGPNDQGIGWNVLSSLKRDCATSFL
ncbi:Bicarbonate transport system permease protein CmpB [Tepidimonas thermarum]|uniref:Bicarbonate transport system permease protein CmpB n=1 Tax=Tepidimonas thermarum TaxID=335431 RepID=A0A554WUA3_9BURK|nr:hypothetical protein [Tepidimonas thermarum]TSE27170.1 Bicarbonate transport system permease protein CmpB [Tepidimonas thermarum]